MYRVDILKYVHWYMVGDQSDKGEGDSVVASKRGWGLSKDRLGRDGDSPRLFTLILNINC